MRQKNTVTNYRKWKGVSESRGPC